MDFFGCLFLPFSALSAVLALASTVFWVWMLIECATKEKTHGNRQMIWIVVIAVANVFGALIYFFVRRPDRIEEYGE